MCLHLKTWLPVFVLSRSCSNSSQIGAVLTSSGKNLEAFKAYSVFKEIENHLREVTTPRDTCFDLSQSGWILYAVCFSFYFLVFWSDVCTPRLFGLCRDTQPHLFNGLVQSHLQFSKPEAVKGIVCWRAGATATSCRWSCPGALN